MKEKPKGASKTIKLKDTGEYEYDFKEPNRYDPLKSDEYHHKQLLATDEEEEELTEKVVEEHDKYLELKGTNQQGSRPSAKSKGKCKQKN